MQIGPADLTQLTQAKAAAFRASQIGIVYQKPHFVSALSVLDNLLLANYLAHQPTLHVRASWPINWALVSSSLKKGHS